MRLELCHFDFVDRWPRLTDFADFRWRHFAEPKPMMAAARRGWGRSICRRFTRRFSRMIGCHEIVTSLRLRDNQRQC
jgi:hypothetical protein